MNLQNRTGLLSKPYIASSTSSGELSAPVDVASLSETYGEQFEDLLAAFIEHSDLMFTQLEKDTQSHDKDSILNLLHQLKAMCAGVFANELTKSVRELEQKCNQNDVAWSDIEYELSECRSLYERVRSYVWVMLEIQLS